MLPGVCQHMFGRRRRDSIFLPAPIGTCTIKRSWVGIYCSLVAPKHMDMVIWSLLAVFPGSSQTSHEACSSGPSMWFGNLGAASKVTGNEKQFSVPNPSLVQENGCAGDGASTSLVFRETVDLILCGCFPFNYFHVCFKFIIFFIEVQLIYNVVLIFCSTAK